MKEQFVPYELALKLKELGFNEECLAFFYKEEEDVVFETCSPYNANRTINYISAPLWQQAFDLFRDNYEFHSSFTFHTDYFECGYKNVYEVHLEQLSGNKIYLITPVEGFKTYEEARLECLKKLIEIVENENTSN